jgi:hypothetical protein
MVPIKKVEAPEKNPMENRVGAISVNIDIN